MKRYLVVGALLVIVLAAPGAIAPMPDPADCIVVEMGGVPTFPPQPPEPPMVPAPDPSVINECTSDPLGDGYLLCREYTTVHNDNAYVHGQTCVYANGQVGYSCEYANYRTDDGWETSSAPPGCTIYQ